MAVAIYCPASRAAYRPERPFVDTFSGNCLLEDNIAKVGQNDISLLRSSPDISPTLFPSDLGIPQSDRVRGTSLVNRDP